MLPVSVAAELADGGGIRLNRLHGIAFDDKVLAGDNDPGVGRNAGKHQPRGGIVNNVDREKYHLVGLVDRPDAQVSFIRERHDRARQDNRLRRIGPQGDLGGHAGRQRLVLVGHGDLDAEGPRRGRRVAADIA